MRLWRGEGWGSSCEGGIFWSIGGGWRGCGWKKKVEWDTYIL